MVSIEPQFCFPPSSDSGYKVNDRNDQIGELNSFVLRGLRRQIGSRNIIMDEARIDDL